MFWILVLNFSFLDWVIMTGFFVLQLLLTNLCDLKFSIISGSDVSGFIKNSGIFLWVPTKAYGIILSHGNLGIDLPPEKVSLFVEICLHSLNFLNCIFLYFCRDFLDFILIAYRSILYSEYFVIYEANEHTLNDLKWFIHSTQLNWMLMHAFRMKCAFFCLNCTCLMTLTYLK